MGVRLKAMEQEQYGIEEYLYLILFNQQYGTRIAAERLTIPTVDAGVEPAYVFSPRVLKPGANYPGLVIVHGSYHGALDPAIFGLIAAAVDHGYIVIFPEYRGSRGYGQAQYDAIDFGGKEVDDVVAAADYLAPPVRSRRTASPSMAAARAAWSCAGDRAFPAASPPRWMWWDRRHGGLYGLQAGLSRQRCRQATALWRQEHRPGCRTYIDVSPLNHVRT